MIAKRLFALLVAVGLVVGALWVRGDLSLAVPTGDGQQPAGTIRVVCARELEPACADLEGQGLGEISTQDVERTTAALAEETGPSFDAWLTLQPWPQLARDRREAGLDPLLGDDSAVLARSRVLVAVWSERAEVLDASCGAELTWSCVGDNAASSWADLGGEERWGPLKAGFNRPGEQAEGLLSLAQASGSYFDTGAFTSRQLQSPGYFAWLAQLSAAVRGASAQTPLDTMLTTGPASFDLTGVLEAVASQRMQRAAQRASGLELREAGPAMTADVVVVGVGEAGQQAADAIAGPAPEVLARHGWRVEGEELAPGLEPVELARDNGLPSAAALEALRRTWLEVRR